MIIRRNMHLKKIYARNEKIRKGIKYVTGCVGKRDLFQAKKRF